MVGKRRAILDPSGITKFAKLWPEDDKIVPTEHEKKYQLWSFTYLEYGLPQEQNEKTM